MAFDYASCTKDQLDEHAAGMLLSLDLRKSLDVLITETKAHEAKLSGVPKAHVEANAPPKGKPKFLRHPVNNYIFEYTETLHEAGLIPCDERGVNA